MALRAKKKKNPTQIATRGAIVKVLTQLKVHSLVSYSVSGNMVQNGLTVLKTMNEIVKMKFTTWYELQ